MKLTSSTRSSKPNIFQRMFNIKTNHNHALNWLNATQFLGVINDNVFKFVMAFLLIDALGKDQASNILSATGAIYVIPFLLFSSSAGILADRFSKQRLLVLMKTAEIIVMILAIFAFANKTPWGCYSLLFILATHSAMFGPSKYGIIPELVTADKVSRANGLITSFTYLAIIIGTFLASFLTEITNRHFTWIAGFCLLVAVGGFVSSLFIKKTEPQGSVKKMNIFFVREIYHTLVSCRTQKHLLPSIFGSAFFLFIGAFTQLNIIPFAINSLNLNEVAGGYLFLATALGIAAGSYLGGKASRKRIELGLSCLAGTGIALFFILMAFFSTNIYLVTLFLVFIGILGGVFIVPFDTFIQLNSPDEKRGQTIAAANFLSFAGVLIASISLYLFTQIFDLSSSHSFGLIGILTLCVTFVLTVRLSDLSLSFLSRKIFHPLLRYEHPHIEAIEKASNPVLVLVNGNWLNAFLLLGSVPSAHLLIPTSRTTRKHWFLKLFYSIHFIPEAQSVEALLNEVKEFQKEGVIPCVLIDKPLLHQPQALLKRIVDFFQRSSVQFFQLSVEGSSLFSRKTLRITKVR